MDGPRDYHTKWSKRKKYHMILPIMWNLKKYTNKLTYKTEIEKKKNRNRPTDIEKKLMVTKGELGRDKLGLGD